MDGDKIKRRRLQRLAELVEASRGRHDTELALSEVAPGLSVKHFLGGIKFVDLDNPVYEGGSDQAYDYSMLLEEGLIEVTYLDEHADGRGGRVRSNPGVRVTPPGFDTVTDIRKSWLKRAIEKQPMTFVSIVVTLIISIASGVGGWFIGRKSVPTVDSSEALPESFEPGLPQILPPQLDEDSVDTQPPDTSMLP